MLKKEVTCVFEIDRNKGSTILIYNLTEGQSSISMTTFSVVISEKATRTRAMTFYSKF